jgi:hypothetical protein
MPKKPEVPPVYEPEKHGKKRKPARSVIYMGICM